MFIKTNFNKILNKSQRQYKSNKKIFSVLSYQTTTPSKPKYAAKFFKFPYVLL